MSERGSFARFLPTAVLVAGLLLALGLATWLAYDGGEALDLAFTYQNVVVAAERDADVLSLKAAEGASADELRPYEKLLDEDLARIDAAATDREERAPIFAFPANAADYTNLSEALDQRAALGRARFERSDQRNVRTRDLSNVLFALVALLFVLLQGRLRRRIDEGRTLVEGLQRAFISRPRSITGVSSGCVLLSATQGAAVGGDVFDVFSFDDRHTLFMIADVSGKGIDAAVDTALIKYTVRALFHDDADPGRVLSRFGKLYAQSAERPESFVVLFVGAIDAQTGEVRYASAGHEPAFLRRGKNVERLAVTGPIVGIDPDFAYESSECELAGGDMIVLSTDGLTESRDAKGEFLGADGAEAWIAQTSGGAQNVADGIVQRLRRRSPRIADDLAVLVVRFDAPAPAATASEAVCTAPATVSARR